MASIVTCPGQISNVLTVIDVITRPDLSCDQVILFFSQSDGFVRDLHEFRLDAVMSNAKSIILKMKVWMLGFGCLFTAAEIVDSQKGGTLILFLALSEGILSMRILILLMLLAVTATGCSSRKDFYATGGSRADGSIDMAYNFKQFETPIVDIAQAKTIANDKCAVWGYERAQAFGGQTENCQARNGFGDCVAGQVVVKYQCIGNITPSNQTTSKPVSAPSAMLTPVQYKELRVKVLMDQNLPYSEYQKKYQAIMAE